MPSKYSHSHVLAQYSSQGIISLPNDDCLRASAQSRAASAAVSRRRTASIATKSSGYQSLTSRSVNSGGGVPGSRTYNLAGSGKASAQRRVVIVQSDSEDESNSEEDDEEWVRPQPKLSARSARPLRAQSPRPEDSTASRPPSTLPRASRIAQRQSAKQASQKVIERMPETKESRMPPKTPKKKAGGVKALIQARHEADMNKAAHQDTEHTEPDNGLSLREFLQTPNEFPAGIDKPLTVKEFLHHVPAPDAEPDNTNSKGKAEKTVDSGVPPAIQSVREHKSRSAISKSASRQQTLRNQTNVTKASSESSSLPHETEPNFAAFSDGQEEPEFPFPIAHAQAKSNKPLNNASETSEIATIKAMPTISLNPPEAAAAYTNDEAGQAATTRPRNPRRQDAKPQKKGLSHSRAMSSLSSLDIDVSSIFGVSSVGGTTQATSGYSPASRNKKLSQRDWELPRFQLGAGGDTFANMFHDINNTTTTSTSDEEVNDQEHDLPAPQLQSIPESELFTTGKWGTISAGQNTSTRARQADEMSEMSAVFPPDIGRYKYDGERGGRLATVLAGPAEIEKPQRTGSFKSKAKKDRKDGGLLRKLRRKTET